MINERSFKFHPHTIKLLNSKVLPESFRGGNVPALGDFNNDGLLDLIIIHHA
ncbi:MAG: FG-GAP repeat protein [Thermoguttaceae bacterium]|nr:FG-GAP repeat protein [Thermoguttaceae bacterium]MDW8080211.1 FG-GAP repeat protein [Thermoguttaceae bacterium]